MLNWQEAEPSCEGAQLGHTDAEEAVAFAVLPLVRLEKSLKMLGISRIGERVQLTLHISQRRGYCAHKLRIGCLMSESAMQATDPTNGSAYVCPSCCARA
jgi:hypothetical protein